MKDKMNENVYNAIQYYLCVHFTVFSTKQLNELIDATLRTYHILYDMYTRYGVDYNGYFEVYDCNMDLRNICVVIDEHPYYYQTFIDILCDTSVLIQNPKNHFADSKTNKSYKINLDLEDVYKKFEEDED